MITVLGFAAIFFGWLIAGHLVAVHGKSRSYMTGMTIVSVILIVLGHTLVLHYPGF